MVLCGGSMKMTQTKLPLTEKHQSSCRYKSWGGAGLSPAHPTEFGQQQGCKLFDFLLVQDHYLAIWVFFLMDPEVRVGFLLSMWHESPWFWRPINWTPLSCPSPKNAHHFCLTHCAFEPDRSGLNPSFECTSCINLGKFLCLSEP